MDEFMRTRQSVQSGQAEEIVRDFVMAIERCEALWGDHAFRRPEGGGWRDQTLAGMYDAQMLSVVRISDDTFESALQSRDRVIEATRRLFLDEDFDKTVRTGTNTPNRIKYRVHHMKRAIEEA